MRKKTIILVIILIIILSTITILTMYNMESNKKIIMKEQMSVMFRISTNYMITNPEYFNTSNFLSYYQADKKTNDCGYDMIFHELFLANKNNSWDCNPPLILLKTYSPRSPEYSSNLSHLSLQNYSSPSSYSMLLVYMFEDSNAASFFSKELVSLIKEVHDADYSFAEYYDAPSYFVLNHRPDTFDFYHYSRAMANFIDYPDALGFFHTVVMQDDALVIVHKVYSDETRIFVNS